MKTYIIFFTTFFWLVFIISFIRDRSKYRNCYYLFFALSLSLLLLLYCEIFKVTVFLEIFLLLILILPFFLIINGILMLKREGRGLSHMLSLILGLLIGLGEVATFLAVILIPELASSMQYGTNYLFQISRVSMLISNSIIYVSMSFAVFILYCVFLQIIPIKRNFNYIIVHGSGLINGDKVPKLLSNRIDKAIEIYKKSSVPAKIILSGGQGSDEKISEAEAMKRYCLDKEIPSKDLIKEDKSKTTLENLKNSKTIINGRSGDKNAVLVTSNYHVYRALRYCKKIKLKCNGVGSHVALYYWPSALIREYVAIHFEKKHLVILIIGWLLIMILTILVY